MKAGFIATTLVLCGLAMSAGSYAQDDLPVLEGPYLGQTPPGTTAKPFASGIVNTEEWGDTIGFSLDMNKIYVTRWRHSRDAREPESVTFERTGNTWQKTAMRDGARKPFHAPDGNTLYYGTRYQERTADGWSEMKSLGGTFEELRVMSLQASRNGMLVLDEMGTNGNGIMRYSKLVDGKREAPQPLPREINTGTWNAHPFIAPDESYIMWDGERESGFGDNDLYISFRRPDGSWGEAINLGDRVNTDAEEGGPQVTPDGKYLFFNRMVPSGDDNGTRQSDLYWIDAQFIEDLRPKQ